MEVVHCRPIYGHVTDQSSGLGEVALLQNHYCALHVAVHKMDTEVGVHCRPPLTVPTGNPMDPSAPGKDTLYILGYGVSSGVFH